MQLLCKKQSFEHVCLFLIIIWSPDKEEDHLCYAKNKQLQLLETALIEIKF